MGCQRQFTVDDNTDVASGVRDGDASAEHQDVMAVNLVHWIRVPKITLIFIYILFRFETRAAQNFRSDWVVENRNQITQFLASVNYGRGGEW